MEDRRCRIAPIEGKILLSVFLDRQKIGMIAGPIVF